MVASETMARSATRGMVTSTPERVSSRAASMMARRVRSFCLSLPCLSLLAPSPGGFLLLSVVVAAIPAPLWRCSLFMRVYLHLLR